MRGKNGTAFQTGPESVYPSFAHWQLHWVYLFNCLLTYNEPITLQQPILALGKKGMVVCTRQAGVSVSETGDLL